MVLSAQALWVASYHPTRCLGWAEGPGQKVPLPSAVGGKDGEGSRDKEARRCSGALLVSANCQPAADADLSSGHWSGHFSARDNDAGMLRE